MSRLRVFRFFWRLLIVAAALNVVSSIARGDSYAAIYNAAVIGYCWACIRLVAPSVL